MMERRTILAIDPGPEQTGFVLFDEDQLQILDKGIIGNFDMLKLIDNQLQDKVHVVIEMVASYGMPVGAEVFNTCIWIGRYYERATVLPLLRGKIRLMFRREVKMELCGNNTAKDSNIRQSILDVFPATGGGATPQVGTKADPGLLYGVSKDIWAALALVVTSLGRESLRQQLAQKHGTSELPF